EGEPLEASHAELKSFLQPLCEANFDTIINLSFSPASSFLTDYLASSRTDVRGYTRHSDGHFNIPDDTSAYFYAQVGIGRANRYPKLCATKSARLRCRSYFIPSAAHLCF